MHAPSGYVDLQVNGYADVDFNADELRSEDVAAVCRRLRDDGVAGILATVITADIDAMCRRLANICPRARSRIASIADMIWGIHIEGPFLNETAGLHRRTSGRHRPAGRRRHDEAAARRGRRPDADRNARTRTRRRMRE